MAVTSIASEHFYSDAPAYPCGAMPHLRRRASFSPPQRRFNSTSTLADTQLAVAPPSAREKVDLSDFVP